jgi:hypothetical protein
MLNAALSTRRKAPTLLICVGVRTIGPIAAPEGELAKFEVV